MTDQTADTLADGVTQWFTSDEFRQDPYDFFDRLRSEEPVHWCEAVNAWVVTDFDLGDELFRRSPVVRSPEGSDHSYMYAEDGTLRPTWRLDHETHRWRDGEELNRYRRLVTQVMNPRAIRGWHQQIRDILDAEVERVLPLKEADLIQEFVYELPMKMICAVFGVPPGDHHEYRRWTEDWFAAVQPATPPDVAQRGDDAAQNLEDHVRALIEIKRRDPDDSMLGLLIAARDDDDGRLTDAELVSMTASMMGAGHDTTGAQVGNAILALLRNPAEMEHLRAAPDQTGRAAEEALRYEPSAMLTPRYAAEDFVLGDRQIQANDTLYVIIQATGRSPRAFDEPDRFWVDRPNNKHLAFALGPHFCCGAQLARVELTVMLEAVAARFTDLKLEADDLRWRNGLGIRGLETLPVSWS